MAISDAMARIGAIARAHGLPEPPAQPAAARRAPLSLGEIYAANTVTARELERIRDLADLAERRRRYEYARMCREARQDAMAEEWGASHVR